MNSKKIDVIIISYNTLEHTLKCISSIIETGIEEVNEIIVVDNASTDGSPETISIHYPEVKLIVNNENLGYAKAVNIGVRAGKSDIVIISNNDVIYHHDSIKNLKSYFEENINAGAVGPQQLYMDGRYQYSFGDLPGIKLGLKKLFFIYHIQDYIYKKSWMNGKSKVKQVAYIDGAVIATRRDVFEKVAGFDEDYFFFTEEADYCFKLVNLGLQVIYNPKSIVTHFRGASDTNPGYNEKRHQMMISSKVKFCNKHLTFQQTKFYIIYEIVYSLNMTLLWHIINLFKRNNMQEEINQDNQVMSQITPKTKSISKQKVEYNKMMFNLWLKEFKKFLGEHE